MLNTILGSLSGGVAAATASYESIASATGTGSSGTITFSSIPSTYVALQLRMNWIATVSGNGCLLQINGDTGSNYDNHWLRGNGTAASASQGINTAANYLPTIITGSDTTYATTSIVDIHNYQSTTQYKTIRSFGGLDKNGSGEVVLVSGLWRNTNAINSLQIYMGSGSFTTGSTFALYGIKGA